MIAGQVKSNEGWTERNWKPFPSRMAMHVSSSESLLWLRLNYSSYKVWITKGFHLRLIILVSYGYYYRPAISGLVYGDSFRVEKVSSCYGQSRGGEKVET